jgi:hypothetical protein
MPNRYSKFYYVERTGGVSVSYKGSFADEFCEIVENQTGRVEEGATIILKGGKTAELVQYPNFTDTATDSDGDGLADTEELLKGTAWIDFTLPYELYTGQRLPAGVRALIPVFGYTSDPSEYSTNGSGIADIDVNPVSLRVTLYGNARRGDIDEGDDTDEVFAFAEAVVFVPCNNIRNFGFRYQKDKETIDFGNPRKNSTPAGFATLYNSDTYKINEKVFVYDPKKATDFNTFMGQVVSKVGNNVKIDFITNRSGITDVQAYQSASTANAGRVARVFAIDRSKDGKTTPDFVANHKISEANQTSYYIIPKPARANDRGFAYGQMEDLVEKGTITGIAPWEISFAAGTFENERKRVRTLTVGEITEVSVTTYPWFAEVNYEIKWTPAKRQVDRVEITHSGSDSERKTGIVEANPYDGRKKQMPAKITCTIESTAYGGLLSGKQRVPRKINFSLIVQGGPDAEYLSADAAAAAFGGYINSRSIRQKREYGAYIYEKTTPQGVRYSYTEPHKGLAKSVHFERSGTSGNTWYRVDNNNKKTNATISNVVALIHTHGAFDNTTRDEWGHEWDYYLNDFFSIGDLEFSLAHDGITIYLATSAGMLLKMEPIVQMVTLINSRLPRDHKHPQTREEAEQEVRRVIEYRS